jgi:hypothetical protein
MGDVLDMLGVSPKHDANSAAALQAAGQPALNILAGQPKVVQKVKREKPKGMSREVFDLMRNEDGAVEQSAAVAVGALNGAAPAFALGFKNKRTTAYQGKWSWERIHSSSRPDQSLEIFHWVKTEMRTSEVRQKTKEMQCSEVQWYSV